MKTKGWGWGGYFQRAEFNIPFPPFSELQGFVTSGTGFFPLLQSPELYLASYSIGLALAFFASPILPSTVSHFGQQAVSPAW